jgi:hypothetical protein
VGLAAKRFAKPDAEVFITAAKTANIESVHVLPPPRSLSASTMYSQISATFLAVNRSEAYTLHWE